MPDLKSYPVERLSEKNIKDLAALYNAVFKKDLTTEYFRKKYDTHNFGTAFIGYLAFNESGEAIAFYGVLPSYFQMNGKTILVAQSADTMTNPAYQKHGLFIYLAQKTYELARQNKVKFLYRSNYFNIIKA